jgi:biofilm PGA synthesis N-glycosyltransferase PgaC
MLSIYLITALALVFIHFSVPLVYYYYLKSRWLKKPWDIKKDPSYRPRVAIIVPTYNEAGLIESKLDNIFEQDYPKDLMSIIVVDPASTDGTVDIVERYRNRHPDARLMIVREDVRRGKAYALSNALKHVDGEIIVITDADSRWASKDVLSKTVSWLSDPNVGAVTCVKKPEKKGPLDIEAGYRDFYNIVRVGESKKWSTPIFHGELAAYKKDLLIDIGGFPLEIGADDSHSATLIALRGKDLSRLKMLNV